MQKITNLENQFKKPVVKKVDTRKGFDKYVEVKKPKFYNIKVTKDDFNDKPKSNEKPKSKDIEEEECEFDVNKFAKEFF